MLVGPSILPIVALTVNHLIVRFLNLCCLV